MDYSSPPCSLLDGREFKLIRKYRPSICKKLSFLHFADTQRSVYSTFLCCKQTFATECCTPTRRLRLAFGDFRAPWLFLWGCGRIVLQWLTKFFSCDLSLSANKTSPCVRFSVCCVSVVETAGQFRQQCQETFLQFLRPKTF